MSSALRWTIVAVSSCLALHASVPVVVYLNAESQTAEPVLAMQQEMNRLTAPLDLDLQWRDYAKRDLYASSERLVVVTLRGSCNTDSPRTRVSSGQSLASVIQQEGRILPFVSLECDRLRAMLTSVLLSQDSGERNRTMGRAMARALAHELYHYLGQDKEHAAHGVGQTGFGTGHLTSDRFGFDNRSVDHIRHLLTHH